MIQIVIVAFSRITNINPSSNLSIFEDIRAIIVYAFLFFGLWIDYNNTSSEILSIVTRDASYSYANQHDNSKYHEEDVECDYHAVSAAITIESMRED